MRASAITILIAVSGVSACDKPASGPGRRVPGQAIETKAANAPDQQPAFPGQTRAPYLTANVSFDARTIATGLDHPWCVAFLPGGGYLVTERPGRLNVIDRGGAKQEVAGVPKVDAAGQGGLFEIALDPDFASNATVFLTYAEPREGGNGTALARARLVREGAPRLEGGIFLLTDEDDGELIELVPSERGPKVGAAP